MKERGFDLKVENYREQYYQKIIESRGWQMFCKHPKVAAITMVLEFYANVAENTSTPVVFVRGK